MNLFSKQKVINKDCLIAMKEMEDCSIDCILTDPPYGISFMSKSWDKNIPSLDYWKEALRICKPGAHMLCFGGTRTYHRLACAIEDADWQIRDCLMWIYGNGFPKSNNHFGSPGYGTALKPAYEPIILAMKPLEGTYKENFEKWHVAGINIDKSRIETSDIWIRKNLKDSNNIIKIKKNIVQSIHSKGRWPANVLFDEEASRILDEQSENASRFFYCAKASMSERNEGCENLTDCEGGMKNSSGRQLSGRKNLDPYKKVIVKNNHPTVKPVKLLEYLLKLIFPSNPNAIVLDPFCGSGSTLVAAKNLCINAIGIELDPHYCEISQARISA
jgi:DNA modification methylase